MIDGAAFPGSVTFRKIDAASGPRNFERIDPRRGRELRKVGGRINGRDPRAHVPLERDFNRRGEVADESRERELTILTRAYGISVGGTRRRGGGRRREPE